MEVKCRDQGRIMVVVGGFTSTAFIERQKKPGRVAKQEAERAALITMIGPGESFIHHASCFGLVKYALNARGSQLWFSM